MTTVLSDAEAGASLAQQLRHHGFGFDLLDRELAGQVRAVLAEAPGF